MINFETKIEDIREVSKDRKYWFVRTYSGITFQDYIENRYVGIGFNNVPYQLIKDSSTNDGKSILKNFIENNTRYEGGEATKWANQLSNFEHTMKQGDIVIIPSENSDQLAIGEIASNVKLVDDKRTFKLNDKFEEYPEKRRKVNWLSFCHRSDFKGDLQGMFSVRQALTSIDKYAEVIEGQISSLFITNGETHLVIQINQDQDINAFYLADFLNSITYFYTEFCKYNGIDENDKLFIKIKVQSKGKLALKALTISGILGLSIIFAMSNDPSVKFDLGTYGSFEGSSDGFLKSLSEFFDEKQERRERAIKFQDSIRDLDVIRRLTPEDIDQTPNEIEKQGKKQ